MAEEVLLLQTNVLGKLANFRGQHFIFQDMGKNLGFEESDSEFQDDYNCLAKFREKNCQSVSIQRRGISCS